MKKKFFKIIFTVVTVFMLASISFAQFDGADKKLTVEYKNSDVREVVISILKSVDLSYTLFPEVQGQVTVSVKDVPLLTVLENILQQVDCTWSYAGGVVVIKKRELPPAEPQSQEITSTQSGKPAKVIRKLIIRSSDPLLIAMLLSGSQNYFGSPEPTQSSYSFGGFGNNMMGGFGGFSGQGGFGGNNRR